MLCRFCNEPAVKNGKVRGLQRYRCSSCEYNFVPARIHGHVLTKKCLAFLKRHYEFKTYARIASELGVTPQTAHRWCQELLDSRKCSMRQYERCYEFIEAFAEIEKAWEKDWGPSVNAVQMGKRLAKLEERLFRTIKHLHQVDPFLRSTGQRKLWKVKLRARELSKTLGNNLLK
jgi:transposase-like protein